MFLCECFTYLKANNWDETALNSVLGSMEYFGPLRSGITPGIAVTMHFLEHYLSSLKFVAESSDSDLQNSSVGTEAIDSTDSNDLPNTGTPTKMLPAETIMTLLEPFFKIVAEVNSSNERLLEEVHEKIFKRLTGDLICLELVGKKLFEIAASGKLDERSAKLLWDTISSIETK